MSPKKPSLPLSLLVLVFVISVMSFTVVQYGEYIHMALIFSTVIVSMIGVFVLKKEYNEIESGMITGIMSAMQACLILYTVGPLVSMWIYTGVIPSMIYYGLLISSVLFLPLAFVLCTAMAFVTGTSWGTTGTLGVAIMGIAVGLKIPAPVAAGIILSGAYCGGKLSTVSDTTLAVKTVVDIDITSHIKTMLWTTVPAFVFTLLVTILLGFQYGTGSVDVVRVGSIKSILQSEFFISPITLIAPAFVIILTAFRKPTLPSMWLGIFISLAIFSLTGETLNIGHIVDVLQNGYTPTVSQQIINFDTNTSAIGAYLAQNGIFYKSIKDIVYVAEDMIKFTHRGGLMSMNSTIALIICAFTLGSTMEKCGFVKTLLESIMRPAKTAAGMITATICSSILCDILVADQFLSITVPGKMFRPKYEAKGLHMQTLARTLKDSASFAPLIPWSTCGAYQAGVLNVATWDYFPYALFNYTTPIICIIIAYMGIATFWKSKSGNMYKGGNMPPFGTIMKR